MSTDDRDIESSNPSKNFKVGDFDQRSGFFTPVWESKRRIRSEPPAPSSTSGSSPGGEEAAAAAAPASQGAGKGSKAPSARARSGGKSKRSARNATPVPPAASDSTPATLGAAPLPPAVAAVFDPAIELERAPAASSSAEDAPAPAATATGSAPLAEQPSSQAPSAAEAPARPSAAARALRDAGPNLPPAAFLDAEPEFRDARPAAARAASARSLSRDVSARDVSAREDSPRYAAAPEERTDRSPLHQRSLRATSAAARVHEQLKAKLQAEAAELDESRYDQAPDSQLPALPAQDENDPYPQSLMRRLRRTIRLSTPVPDPVRSIISKYDRG